jgi:HEAT repeat protein
MFNVIPPHQRENSRAFIRGIANQLGISLAGVLLLLGNRVLPSGYLFITGLLTAAVTIYFVWQARKAYGPAVVAALKAGQSHIFFGEEQPFGGFQQDANAVNAAVAGIHSQEVAVRRVAADILGRLSIPEATNAVVGALDDEDPSVRVALLKALSSSRSSAALLDVASLLQDPDPEVRLQAIKTLADLAEYPQGQKAFLRPLLSDPDTAVRCQAAGALLNIDPDPEAEAMLVALAQTESQTGEGIAGRIMALEALAAYGGQNAYQIAVDGLRDPSPAIRRSSAKLIAQIDTEQCLVPLQITLGDEDALVRQAAAEALGRIGLPALETTLQALNSPRLEEGALIALQYLPARRAASRIQEYAEENIERALFYHDLWQQCRGFFAGRQEPLSVNNASMRQQATDIGPLLADSLRIKARTHATHALQAIGVIGNQDAIFLAIDNLSSPVTGQRANALETLDSVGESSKIRRLFPLWETADPPTPPADDRWLETLLEDNDPWLRACAAMFATKHEGQLFRSQLNQLAKDDPDPLVRESAQLPSHGEAPMDTLQTLSTMERILFLRRVPLFATLPVSDLKQIAAVAGERAFGNGTIIAEQGEPGDVLYIIVSGEVIVTAVSADGEQKELGLRHSGDFVGEMAIISEETRMANLTARGELRTLCISQSQFKEILRLRPEASLAVMSVLCTRLREYQRYD